ncbi:MAG: PAS domain S-box protein [Chryseolinea sp.]
MNVDAKAGLEVSQLIDLIDWDKTSLGSKNSWSETLQTSVNICLHATFPTVIMWGPEMSQLYNDGFSNVIGLKHPAALGQSAVETWKEFWPEVGEMLHAILRDGESFQLENRPFEMNRTGTPEMCYFTISCSPIFDSANTVKGIFATVVETTEIKSTERQRRKQAEENEIRLRMVIQSTHIGTWDYYPLTGELNWSDECKKIYAIPERTNLDFETFAKQIHEEDRTFVNHEIQKSMLPEGDGNYDIQYRILRFGSEEIRWIRAQGKVFFNDEKQPERFIGTVVDITEQRNIEEVLKENELKSRLAMEASGMGSFVWEVPKSNFQFSATLAEMFGYKDVSGLRQQDFTDRIHPDDRETRLKAHQRAFETGTLFYEARVVWPDESIHWIRLNGKLLYDNKGLPSQMFGTTQDITRQKAEERELEKLVNERTLSLERNNRALKRSEEQYHRVIAEVQDYAIILLDPNGIIRTWNKGAEKIKGYSEAEIVGKHFSVFYLPEDQERKLPHQLITEAERSGRAIHEGWRVRKDGSRFWGSITITALHNAKDEIIGFSKVTRDLTDKKNAEDQLLEYTRQLEVKNKELEQFAYVASHDLQEPLRKIQTFSGIIQQKNSSEEAVAKYLSKIDIAALRLSQLVKSLLDYSRLSNVNLYEDSVDLNLVLENVKNDFELVIEEKKVQIISTPLPTIKGMTIQLGQLFANLIGNAIKFSKDIPVIHIAHRSVPKKEVKNNPGNLGHDVYAEISFRDNGIGFEQKFESKIFTIFQRLHARHEFEGTGIGLALCKRIMLHHDGYITCESSPGKGATFYLYFPDEIVSK